MFNDNVVQFMEWNNFCIYTFLMGPTGWALYTIATMSRLDLKAYNMGSLNYGSYRKSVNTKVVPFHELNNIVIEHFPLK